MAKIYNEPIDPNSNIDWGVGDESTGNKPLSGAVVQKFIKDNINSLKNRAHTLEENVNGVPADPEHETPAVPGLLDRVESIENTINGDGEGSDGLSDRMSAVEATVNGTEGADGLSDRMSAAEGRLDDIDGQEGALADLDERMDQAEKNISDLQEDVSGLQGTTSEMQETLSNIDPAAIEAALKAFDPDTLDARFQSVHDGLDTKAGYFYKDASINEVLVFKDQATADAWEGVSPRDYESPLILGRFASPSDFEGIVTIAGVDPAVGTKYIQYGTKGQNVQATFQVYRKNGNVLSPEPSVVTIIMKNDQGVVLLEKQLNVLADGIINFNIDDYLIDGPNIITVRAKGSNTGTTGSASYTIVALNLILTDTFKINQVIEQNGVLSVTWNVDGSGEKFVKWYIDGSDTLPNGYVLTEDSSTEVPAHGTKNIPISSLTPGKHTLQYYAYRNVGTTGKFYSNLLYRDFVIDTNNIDTSSLSSNYVAILNAFSAPVNTAAVAPDPMIVPGTGTDQDPIILSGLTQYEASDIYYCVYYKDLAISKNVVIDLNGSSNTYSLPNLNGTNRYEIKSYDEGLIPLTFTCGTETVYFNLVVAQTSYNIKNLTDNLAFNFSGSDNSNYSGNPGSWQYSNELHTYRGTLSNFEWISTSGWNNGRLIFSDGAEFVTDYQPFHRSANASSITSSGFTFEIEFKTSRVLNEDAIVLDLRDSNDRGLLITTSEITYTSGIGQKQVSTKYKPEENIRVSIVINPTSGSSYHNLIMMYIDGVLTSIINYTNDDSFDSDAVFAMTGTSDATVELKQVRCYDKNLGPNEIFNNYMLYRDTPEELLEVYNRNDIYTSNAMDSISMDKLADATPVIIITGKDLDDPVTAGSPDPYDTLMKFKTDNKGTYVRMYSLQVINKADPSKNLYLEDLSMRCQGTSSMAYPVKNFRFYTQNDYGTGDSKKYDSRPWNPKPGAADSGKEYYTQMWVGGPADDPKSGTKLEGKKRKYAFKNGSQPVKTWCLKADYAESSSTHNTGIARLWNQALRSVVLPANQISPRYYLQPGANDSTFNVGETIAQRKAREYGYKYDVRTTVDGFPITLFYHTHENEPLRFVGRYNWNNDKSTESVYGFCDIPGFDVFKDDEGNERELLPGEVDYGPTMECWEVKEGDMLVNQFLDLSNWEHGQEYDRNDTDPEHSRSGSWKESFEARYPGDDGKPSEIARARKEVIDPETHQVTDPGGALWRVCKWVHSTKGASHLENGKMVKNLDNLYNKFVDEKWDYFDVYKMAAYYCYLMRFGAVDQVVKNAMFTTEDGLHWFYINYDNDTINGVRNDGALKFGYDIDRQTVDPDSTGSAIKYCYAGHDSVLWNNLEADKEFMQIVKLVDNALYQTGILTYTYVIDMFNNQQSAKWAERTHNEDYIYKYIEKGSSLQYPKLQGPRKSHRQWWLSNRFSLMDAINGVGSYMSNFMTIKPNGNLKMRVGDGVTISPSNPTQIFAWSMGGAMKESGAHGEVGHDIRFAFPTDEFYAIGAELKFYNTVYMTKLDISSIADMVGEFNFENINSDAFESTLTELILGKTPSSSSVSPKINSLPSIPGMDSVMQENGKKAGLQCIKYLEKFVMNYYTGLTSIDLSHNKYLKYVDLRHCDSLASILLPDEAPIEDLYYPGNVETINLNGLTHLNNFALDNYARVKTVNITGCPRLQTKALVFNWLSNKTAADSACSLTLDNIDWSNVSNTEINRLITFWKNGGTLNLTGHIRLTNEITSYTLAHDLEVMFGGTNVWKTTSRFYIEVDPSLIIMGPTTLLEGESYTYTTYYIGNELDAPDGEAIWNVLTTPTLVRTGTELGRLTGEVTTTENGHPTAEFEFRCSKYSNAIQKAVNGRITINIIRRTYPSADLTDVYIDGSNNIIPGEDNAFELKYTNTAINGAMTATWAVSGALYNWVTVHPQGTDGMDGCIIRMPVAPHGTPEEDYLVVNGSITVTLRYKNGTNGHAAGDVVGNEGIKSLIVGYKHESIALSAATNPYAMAAIATLPEEKVPNRSILTKRQAGFISQTDLQPGVSAANSIFYQRPDFRNYCKSFDEFESFTGLDFIPVYLFSNCTALESIVLPSSISSIKSGAFMNCTHLKRIVIPRNVQTIESAAFSNCSSLEEVVFENGCMISSIGNGAFQNCSKLTHFTIPTTITSLSDSLFSGCSKLASIVIPDNITTMNGYVFSSCSALRTVNFGTGITNIGNYAFQNSGLLNVNIPDNITRISYRAFYGCSSLKTAVIGDGVTNFETEVFQNCTNLESIVFGDNMTSIPNYTCSGCTKLKSIHIGEKIQTISYLYSPAATCYNTTSASRIGLVNPYYNSSSASYYANYNPFKGCTNLETITVDSNNPYYQDGTGAGGSNCIIRVDGTSRTLMMACKNTVIPSNCTAIGDYAFESLNNFESINIPNNVRTISTMAFCNCAALKNVTIAESSALTTIGWGAFSNCSNLLEIRLPDTVTTINPVAFCDCTQLGVMTMASRLATTISNCAFMGCTSLSTVNLPATVTTIGNYAFRDCTYLQTFNIPVDSQLTSIQGGTFYNCQRLEEINIPNTAQSVNGQAFYNCISLRNIHIGENVRTIAADAFRSTSESNRLNLTNITVDVNNTIYTDGSYQGGGNCIVRKSDSMLILGCKNTVIPSIAHGIGDYAFAYVHDLNNFVIPDNINSIATYAFAGCIDLMKLKISNFVVSIGDYAFYNCTNLYLVDFGDAVSTIGSYAFQGCSTLRTVVSRPLVPPSLGSNAFYQTNLVEIYVNSVDEYDAYRGHYSWANYQTLIRYPIPSEYNN